MRGPKKILLITNSYPDINSLENVFILPEIKFLLRAGHDVTLMPVRKLTRIDPSLPSEVYVDNSLSKSFGMCSLSFLALNLLFRREFWFELYFSLFCFLFPFNIIRFLKDSFRAAAIYKLRGNIAGFDIKYTYWFSGETIGLIWSGLPFVVTRVHRYDLYHNISDYKGYIPYRKSIVVGLFSTFVLSAQAEQYVKSQWANYIGQLHRFSLGVLKKQPVLCSKELNQLCMVSCSYSGAVKRLEFIYFLAKKLAFDHPHLLVKWTHFGAVFSDLHLDSNSKPKNLIVDMRGCVSNDVVVEFYKHNWCDFFINLSESEGQPVSIMEAMSFGIPIVATAVGGVPEMLQGGGGILVHNVQNLDSVAQEIIRTWQDKEFYLRMRELALITQRNQYDLERNNQKFAEWFYELDVG